MENITLRKPKLPKSAHKVIEALATHGTLIQKEIHVLTKLPSKTVRYAITRLEAYNIVVKARNLGDLRSVKYALNPDFDADLFLSTIKKPIAITKTNVSEKSA